jgi:hypothetical protein
MSSLVHVGHRTTTTSPPFLLQLVVRTASSALGGEGVLLAVPGEELREVPALRLEVGAVGGGQL